ncbi:hypothetical protein WMY93_031557 [Mugilogobius chulae]|uniref:Uncharacterized protein n=1 Tax=Mugilogobius chulae TaxID=88201 RepID=A0AAW0MFT1_9GOBI
MNPAPGPVLVQSCPRSPGTVRLSPVVLACPVLSSVLAQSVSVPVLSQSRPGPGLGPVPVLSTSHSPGPHPGFSPGPVPRPVPSCPRLLAQSSPGPVLVLSSPSMVSWHSPIQSRSWSWSCPSPVHGLLAQSQSQSCPGVLALPVPPVLVFQCHLLASQSVLVLVPVQDPEACQI